MKRFHLVRVLIFLIAYIASIRVSCAQPSITGQVCVRSGTTYEYILSSGRDSVTVIQVCVTGGIIADSGGTCVRGNNINNSKITWNSGVADGSISLTTPFGNTSLKISISNALNGGTINTSAKTQFKDSLSLPSTIECSPASGGNCNPNYAYQWQQSDDAIKWIDITGNTVTSLTMTNALGKTKYYRRKVTETNSGAVEYSDIATVSIVK